MLFPSPPRPVRINHLQQNALRLLKATEESLNPQLRNIVGLLLLTGARKGELLKAHWQHVDLYRKVWLIPTSKYGKARHVPLSQTALDIINQLPRFERCPWLLPAEAFDRAQRLLSPLQCLKDDIPESNYGRSASVQMGARCHLWTPRKAQADSLQNVST